MGCKTLKTIAVDEANYFALQNMGKAGQSFNDVIAEMVRKVQPNGGSA